MCVCVCVSMPLIIDIYTWKECMQPDAHDIYSQCIELHERIHVGINKTANHMYN